MEASFLPSSVSRLRGMREPPSPKGRQELRIATPACALVRNDMIFRQSAMLPLRRERLFYIMCMLKMFKNNSKVTH